MGGEDYSATPDTWHLHLKVTEDSRGQGPGPLRHNGNKNRPGPQEKLPKGFRLVTLDKKHLPLVSSAGICWDMCVFPQALLS